LIVINTRRSSVSGSGRFPSFWPASSSAAVWGFHRGLGRYSRLFHLDITGYPYTPYVTISFILIGVLPYLLFKASAWMRYKKNPFPVSYILLALIWSFLTAYVIMVDQVRISGTMVAITQFYKISFPSSAHRIRWVFGVHLFDQPPFPKKILFYPNARVPINRLS
jgi:hypothetical protein